VNTASTLSGFRAGPLRLKIDRSLATVAQLSSLYLRASAPHTTPAFVPNALQLYIVSFNVAAIISARPRPGKGLEKIEPIYSPKQGDREAPHVFALLRRGRTHQYSHGGYAAPQIFSSKFGGASIRFPGTLISCNSSTKK
jgi:hypothetical protein